MRQPHLAFGLALIALGLFLWVVLLVYIAFGQ